MRLELVPHENSSYGYIIAKNLQHETIEVATEILEFSHEHSEDIKEILRVAGRLDAHESRVCEEVFQSYTVCTATCRPAEHRKVSLNHVKYPFN